jgi:hypothetical protein
MSGSFSPHDEARIAAAKNAIDDALDLWKAPAVSADFDRRLYVRIEQRSRWWDFLLRPQRLVPVAATACLVIVAGLWVGRPDAPPAPVIRPDQADSALQEMKIIDEFNQLIRPETAAAEPAM